MNKVIKISGIFILAISVLTGCSDKVAVKDNAVEKVKVENKVDKVVSVEENKENEVTNVETGVKVKNDKENVKQLAEQNETFNSEEVKNTLNIWEYAKLNLENNSVGNIVKYFASEGVNGNPKAVSMTTIVDKINTYNKETYNSADILAMLKEDANYSFTELDDSVKNYTLLEQKQLLEKNKIIYMKRDNVLLTTVQTGFGGATDSVFETEDSWQVEGDTVVVNYVNVVTNKVTATMTLKINNKNYEGGVKKTAYYVDNFIYV